MPVHPQVQTLLDAMAQAGGPRTSELSPDEARGILHADSAH